MIRWPQIPQIRKFPFSGVPLSRFANSQVPFLATLEERELAIRDKGEKYIYIWHIYTYITTNTY